MQVGIDISPTSTAIYIKNGVEKIYSFSTQKPDNKYVKMLEEVVTFEFIEYPKKTNYSESEIEKAKIYYSIARKIGNLLTNYYTNGKIDLIIEGHSYSSQAGHIIDVATLTGMIKAKIFELLPTADIYLVSPVSLKIAVAETVYGSMTVMEGKRVLKPKKHIKTNHLNTPPNKYQKTDMLLAVHDYKQSSVIKEFVDKNYDNIGKLKSVPKPIDDIVDAYWLMETFKK